MKRLFFFLLVVLFLVCCFLPQAQNFTLSSFFSRGEFTVFSSSNALKEAYEWDSVIALGNEFMLKTPLLPNSKLRLSTKEVRGQMVEIPNTEEEMASLHAFQKQIGFMASKQEVLEGIGVCQYGYSPKIPNFIVLDGKKINLQIVEQASKIVVGYPVILGSY